MTLFCLREKCCLKSWKVGFWYRTGVSLPVHWIRDDISFHRCPDGHRGHRCPDGHRGHRCPEKQIRSEKFRFQLIFLWSFNTPKNGATNSITTMVFLSLCQMFARSPIPNLSKATHCQVLHSRVSFWPCSQILDLAGKACQEQTLA